MEIKKPSADIVKLGFKRSRFNDGHDNITALREDLIAFANRIENLKDQTPWPKWSQNHADSMRDFAKDLNKD